MCDEVLDTGARLGMWWQPRARVTLQSTQFSLPRGPRSVSVLALSEKEWML